MATTLKIISVGNSLGAIFPREFIEKLRVGKGDQLFAVETPEGWQLSAHDPEFARKMEVAESVMRRRRNVLKKLAE